MKKLSNTEAELKKTLLIKKRASQYSAASFKDLETTSKLEPSSKLTRRHLPSIITCSIKGEQIHQSESICKRLVSGPVM